MDAKEAQKQYDLQWTALNKKLEVFKLSGDKRAIKGIRQELSALSVKYIDRKNTDEDLENPYPECVKLAAIAPISQEIGHFLEKSNFALCTYAEENGRGWVPTYKSIELLLAEHFDIDMKLVEKERQHMLDNL